MREPVPLSHGEAFVVKKQANVWQERFLEALVLGATQRLGASLNATDTSKIMDLSKTVQRWQHEFKTD